MNKEPKLKLHPKYKPLIKESSRYTLISGGRGSGKSFSGSIYLLLKTFETGQVILFSRYTMTSAEISVIPEFTEKLDLLGIRELFEVTSKEIINKSTGSRIIFRGLKTGSRTQTANLKSIAGLTIWVLDEAEELTQESVFDTISKSIRKKGVENKIILIFNPPTDKHWLYNRFYLNNSVIPGSNVTKGNTTYIHTTYEDNRKYLNKDFLEEADELKRRDIKKWQHIYGGAFRKFAEGIIFDYKLGEFPTGVESEFGNDFGFSNDPNALVELHMEWKTKTIYIREKIYKTGMRPSTLAESVKLHTGRQLVVCDSASPDLISELENKGVNAKPVKKPKILDRIKLMKDWKFVVDPGSKNIITELDNYTWDKNYTRGERPIDDYNHALDAIGYYIVHKQRAPKKRKRFSIR